VFTGLIRHHGVLTARSPHRITVDCPTLRPQLSVGDSVAVMGVCLTVAELHAGSFSADLLPETALKSTLGSLTIGSPVNLEPALRASDSIGGHFVQGHVDGTTRLLERHETGQGSWRFVFELPDWLAPLTADGGSIAVDGVSLTLQELGAARFVVAVIPTTFRETTLGNTPPGALVNIEADMLVKAVRGAGHPQHPATDSISSERLVRWGYGE